MCCSRSAGTFLTLDICASRLSAEGTVDVRGTVERIRSQRAHSIQMPDQYVFCHHAVIEYAVRGSRIFCDQIRSAVLRYN